MAASAKTVEQIAQRTGPLLLFAGGIVSFGASQERERKGGVDSSSKQQKLEAIMTHQAQKQCSDPSDIQRDYCRGIYSMGVRQVPCGRGANHNAVRVCTIYTAAHAFTMLYLLL